MPNSALLCKRHSLNSSIKLTTKKLNIKHNKKTHWIFNNAFFYNENFHNFFFILPNPSHPQRTSLLMFSPNVSVFFFSVNIFFLLAQIVVFFSNVRRCFCLGVLCSVCCRNLLSKFADYLCMANDVIQRVLVSFRLEFHSTRAKESGFSLCFWLELYECDKIETSFILRLAWMSWMRCISLCPWANLNEKFRYI